MFRRIGKGLSSRSSLMTVTGLELIFHKLQNTCSISNQFFFRGNHLKFYFWLTFQTYLQFSSIWSLSRLRLFVTLWIKHTRLPCPSPVPGDCSNSCPSSWWCHPTISSSVVPFSSCLQSFPASGSYLMSRFFASGGQSIGISASPSVLPMNIQDWFLLGSLIDWISLQSKGLSRVFSNTTVQKHQFFSAQPSSQSNSHIHTRPQEKP